MPGSAARATNNTMSITILLLDGPFAGERAQTDGDPDYYHAMRPRSIDHEDFYTDPPDPTRTPPRLRVAKYRRSEIRSEVNEAAPYQFVGYGWR